MEAADAIPPPNPGLGATPDLFIIYLVNHYPWAIHPTAKNQEPHPSASQTKLEQVREKPTRFLKHATMSKTTLIPMVVLHS